METPGAQQRLTDRLINQLSKLFINHWPTYHLDSVCHSHSYTLSHTISSSLVWLDRTNLTSDLMTGRSHSAGNKQCTTNLHLSKTLVPVNTYFNFLLSNKNQQ